MKRRERLLRKKLSKDFDRSFRHVEQRLDQLDRAIVLLKSQPSTTTGAPLPPVVQGATGHLADHQLLRDHLNENTACKRRHWWSR